MLSALSQGQCSRWDSTGKESSTKTRQSLACLANAASTGRKHQPAEFQFAQTRQSRADPNRDAFKGGRPPVSAHYPVLGSESEPVTDTSKPAYVATVAYRYKKPNVPVAYPSFFACLVCERIPREIAKQPSHGPAPGK